MAIPAGAPQEQAGGRGRRRRHRRPGHAGHERCRLANLVNEAALFAVRRGAKLVHAEDFEAARDRVLMGLKRESMALTDEEKEVIAYHEGGHAVLAYVLDNADPVHKVTILPTGVALGVTQQLPVEERHIYKQEYITDSIVVALGGRLARRSSSGTSPRAPRTTSSGSPSSPVGWRASGACRSASVRWPGGARVRCSSARTSCTPATTPTRRPG